MSYEKASKLAYSVWFATGSLEAKELSDFFARQSPLGSLDHIERAMLGRVLA